ncbi:DUF4395 domain-containing protein [Aquibacillus koreensis]|uniref:DUF4395 domain-containing protein n=1 Tax=Aquibacillus koreensis TaxID=279446 RepID=A0A9X4AJZ8_9BACI|nr:DUF4395 domain-containing protein [Aquibacillus koreensis]MCT2537713.1 DUF4395 domain-containing protein [Aquibacillus koreensis]MDC3420940.1 DUF4395 domain-containing protein [Aquibacillus koreensis]
MTIPKPLVQFNQAFIVITVVLGLLFYKVILLIPFMIGVYMLITKQNPLMMLGKRVLKKPLSLYKQEDKNQQLFNQWIATICLGVSIVSFYLGWIIIGYVSSVMVMVAAGVALLGFCIGCTIRYRFMMWRYKRSKAHVSL